MSNEFSNAKIYNYLEDGLSKVLVNTTDADLVGTFYDNPDSNKGILLFPGFREYRSSLDELAKQLSEHYKVWTFDLNGHGESTGVFNLAHIIQSFYELHKTIKEEYNLEKIASFGNSTGGVAVALASTYQDSELDCLCLTSAPTALQDVETFALSFFKSIPQFLLIPFTVTFDMFYTLTNKYYRENKHRRQCKRKDGSSQFNALHIKNRKEILYALENAPRLDINVHKINIPIWFIYAGNDELLKIDKDLPNQYKQMYDAVQSKNKILTIIDGADHNFNIRTVEDCPFNSNYRYSKLKKAIVHFFKRNLS